MKKIQASTLTMTLAIASAFSPSVPYSSSLNSESTSLLPPTTHSTSSRLLATSADSVEVPPLKRNPPRNVALLIEPTPFTHVSGYSNRFKEMLRYMSKAGDNVDILTVDAKTPKEELPKNHSDITLNTHRVSYFHYMIILV